jgi:hypothetical protein
MSKHSVFMKEIVCKYHPEFTSSPDLQRYGLKHPEIFNIERLIEESLAAVGGYDFVDDEGRDFNCPDNSDSKTVSIVNNGGYSNSKVIIIKNVDTKIGSLRVTIYNPYKEDVDFLYIPKRYVRTLMENDGTSGRASGIKQRIRGTWNDYHDDYNKLERFRIMSFEALAKASD